MIRESPITGEHIDALTEAIRSVSHGGADGPRGLEALAQAVAGPFLQSSLADAIGKGLAEIAAAQRDGLQAIADAIAARDDKEPR